MRVVKTTVVVGPDHLVTLRLPGSLPIGRHSITLVIDGTVGAIGDGPDAEDVIGYDYDDAQGAAFDAVYHAN